MSRINISSGAPWEAKIGYSRAVRKRNMIFVSGTVAVDENGKPIGGDSPKEQARYILDKIGKTLEQVGAQLSDIVRTRIYVTDIKRWQEVGEAHADFLGHIAPATSMVQVSALIRPEYLVEIEAEAMVIGE